MSRDSLAIREFSAILDGIENEVGAIVEDVGVEYEQIENAGIFSAMNEIMGEATRVPRFHILLDPNESDVDNSFEVLADVVGLIEDEVGASVDDVQSATHETRGGLFSSSTETLLFGIAVDVEPNTDEEDVDAEDVVEDIEEEQREDRSNAPTRIVFEGEEVDSE